MSEKSNVAWPGRGNRARQDKKEPIHKNSITALLSEAGIYYSCFSCPDNSASEGYLLRKGKPFTTLPILVTVSHRHKQRTWENETAPKRSRPHFNKCGPVKQLYKNGKPVDVKADKDKE